jgi:hypothetical protein
MRTPRPALRIPAALTLALAAGSAAAEDAPAPAWPRHVLDNGQVALTVYLPDAAKGFYRGERFDGSGLIARAEHKGHAFFGPWKEPHDPADREAAIGPAEEFGMTRPIGYAAAAPGGLFPKIGVGLLAKEPADDKGRASAYGFWKPYRIAEPGAWKVEAAPEAVLFEQSLAGPGGFAVRYEKRITLLPGAPAFTIRHRLVNTGTAPLATDFYNHHFTVIDGSPAGPDYRVVFPFDLSTKSAKGLLGRAELRGRELVFTAEVEAGKPLYVILDGHREAKDNAFEIRNVRTGASLRVRGDWTVTKFPVYVARTALCPEPFLDLALEPGAETAWGLEYTLAADERR